MRASSRWGKVPIRVLLWGLIAFWWLSVAPIVSAQTYDFDEGLETLTKGLVSENRGILKKRKIAVFGIIESKSGKKWEVSSHIEDGIVDALVKNGYRVIERRRIQDVIQKEIKKSTDLWFDQARVAQFGKLVGADFVVTGSYVLWGQGTLKISVRAINVADGEIVAADKVKILTDRIANLLKPEEDEKHLKKARVSPEKPVKIQRIDELTHESGKLGKYKALIIGINDYQGPKIPDLETATNDATAIAKVLREKYGFEVKLLLDREATKDVIYRELRNLTVSTKSDDSVLIYFAGHGDLDRTYDGGWWIPADAIGGNPVTYLDNVQVQKAMRSMKARHVLLISDACYSGTLFGKARSLPAVIDDKFYLSLYNEKSRWGMTSGNKTPVSDQGTGGHSVFAYQLIKELGKSDKPFLSTHELYTRIAPVIANNSEQTPICRPILNTGDQGGEFVFVASVQKEPPLPTAKVHQSTLNKDMLFWQSIKDSNDPALFEAYLKAFPNGIFASIAKRKIENFKQKKETVTTAPVVLKSNLFVEVEPRDARIRILNIGPKFHQGMALDPGSYHTEVSSNGYRTEKMWVKLEPGKDATLRFSLEQKSFPQAESSTKQTPKRLTPVKPSSGEYQRNNRHEDVQPPVQKRHENGQNKVHQSTHNKDMLFWKSVQDSNDPALFDAYLKTFPNGIFASIAKRKIETFKQKKGHTSPVKPSSAEKISGRDGIYVAYTNGIVKDTNTGLEWKAGPDKNTNWDEARSWVQNLSLKGGGWRMPTKDEIKSLYKARTGPCNMTSLFKITAWWVWAGETKDSAYAWIFYFSDGYGYWLDRSTSDNLRAFAVRSRSIGINSPKDAADEYQRDNRHEDVQPPVQKRHENGQNKVHQSTHNKDMLFWKSVQNSNDPALFDAYLKTFPDGIFALIAKQKIEALKQKKGNVSTPPVVLKPRLFVEVEPRGASVRILNIGLKFHQGMALDPGTYHTEVSSNGYKTQKMWIKLESGRNTTLRFSLERKPVAQRVTPNKQTPKRLTPVEPSSGESQRDNRHEDVQPPVQKRHENRQNIDSPDAGEIDVGA